MLAMRKLSGREQMLAEIQAGYGPVAAQIEQIQAPLFRMTEDDLEVLKRRILGNWDAIQEIARSVPSPDKIESWLKAVNGAVYPADIGLDQNQTILGLRSAHYLRDRFTLNRLAYWLDLPLPG